MVRGGFEPQYNRGILREYSVFSSPQYNPLFFLQTGYLFDVPKIFNEKKIK